MEKFKKFIVPIIVVVVLLGIAAALYYLKGNSLSKGKAAEKALNYINNSNLLEAGTTASLVSVKSTSGVYAIAIKISDQEYISYITKDGNILFPQGITLLENTTASQNTSFDVTKTDKPEVKLFVMSFCPYGNQAEELMMPVVDLLKNKADIKLHYVIYENYCTSMAEQKIQQGTLKPEEKESFIADCKPKYCIQGEKYCSMHGIQELNQDVRELCVQKYQKDKFWSFVKGINDTCGSGNVDTCWEGVAQTTGVDINKIKTCQQNEAITLLAEEVKLNEQYSISGSPQTIINGKEYDGGRTAEGFKSAICSGFNSAPSECSQALGSDASGAAASGGCE